MNKWFQVVKMRYTTINHQYLKKGKKLLFIGLRKDEFLEPGFSIWIKTFNPNDKERKKDNLLKIDNSGDILYNKCKFIDTITFFEKEGWKRVNYDG